MGYDEDGDVVIWDSVSPAWLDFHADDERVTHLYSEYAHHFPTFYETVINDMAKYGDKRGFNVCPLPRNIFDTSCIPWTSYTALNINVFGDGTYLVPVITWGKYTQKDGRWRMPLTMQIHHAAADGFHIARFYSDVNEEINRLASELISQ